MTDYSEEDKSFLQKEIERLKNANEALVSEFNTANEENDGDATETMRSQFNKAGSCAVTTLVNLMKFAESESVQMNCAKFVSEVVLGIKSVPGNGDAQTFEKLLKELAGKE
jgi:hypothetical protein